MDVALQVEDPVFGSWSAREFRSHKAARGLIAESRMHEDFLILSALDPAVASIEPAPAGMLGEGVSCPPDFAITDAEGAVAYVRIQVDDTPEAKAALADAYREAERLKVPYRVVDASEICAQPKLRNARLVHACARVRVGPGDRVRILQFLAENGEAPLVEVSRVVAGSPEAVECVLALVSEGTVSVDLRRTLGPEMPVRRLRVDSDAEMD